ncbi:hypothetical protein DFJ73DRAFT_375406 [Zopfochytrium polystomum]|nr:hypothetical protein DFJ73DRAFT_375406 [Zopfochytrium polystomum]
MGQKDHPFFISYRVKDDDMLAGRLASKLEIELLTRSESAQRKSTIHPFFDQTCLNYAEDWTNGFVTGLYSSGIYVLLCSEFGMQNMRNADSKPDNVLLEWELALDLRRIILPILVSRQTTAEVDGRLQKIVIPFNFPRGFPDALHKHKLSPGNFNVSETVQKIYDLQGVHVNPHYMPDIDHVVIQVMQFYSQITQAASRRENPTGHDLTVNMACIDPPSGMTDTAAPVERQDTPVLTGMVEGLEGRFESATVEPDSALTLQDGKAAPATTSDGGAPDGEEALLATASDGAASSGEDPSIDSADTSLATVNAATVNTAVLAETAVTDGMISQEDITVQAEQGQGEPIDSARRLGDFDSPDLTLIDSTAHPSVEGASPAENLTFFVNAVSQFAGEVFLNNSQLKALETWLQPLHNEVKNERERLLRPIVPGARSWHLGQILQFVYNSDDHIFWVHGGDGVGKSTMAAIVAKELQMRSLLGGMWFGYVSQGGYSLRDVVKTLAYGLASFSIHTGTILLRVRERESEGVSDWTVEQMLENLILNPLIEVFDKGLVLEPVVFVIDGVHESYMDELEKAEFMDKFTQGPVKLPAKVKLIVTRSDLPLGEPSISFPVDDPKNQADLLAFAESFLDRYEADNDVIKKCSSLLAKKSSGNFLWLTIVCKMLAADAGIAITEKMILDLPSDGVDSLLDQVLRRAAEDKLDYQAILDVLDSLLFSNEPLTAEDIRHLCPGGHSKHQLERAMRKAIILLSFNRRTEKLSFSHQLVKRHLVKKSANEAKLPVDASLLDFLCASPMILRLIRTDEEATLFHAALELLVLEPGCYTTEELAARIGTGNTESSQVFDALEPVMALDSKGRLRLLDSKLAEFLKNPDRCSDTRFAIILQSDSLGVPNETADTRLCISAAEPISNTGDATPASSSYSNSEIIPPATYSKDPTPVKSWNVPRFVAVNLVKEIKQSQSPVPVPAVVQTPVDQVKLMSASTSGFVQLKAQKHFVKVQYFDDPAVQVLELDHPTLQNLIEKIYKNADVFLGQDIEVYFKSGPDLEHVSKAPTYVRALIERSSFPDYLPRFQIQLKKGKGAALAQGLPSVLPVASALSKVYDCFLSYQWGSKDTVKKIFEDLTKKHGLDVWFDENNMSGSINQAMAEGIDSSKVFVPVLTLAFQKSDNCLEEIRYAKDRKKPKVPVRLLEQGEDAQGEVFVITASLLYADFTGKVPGSRGWDGQMAFLVKEIKQRQSQIPAPAAAVQPPVDQVKLWLKPADIAVDAERHKSAYVDGTRKSYLNNVHSWLQSADVGNVLWLNGGAGLGKSVIAWLVSQHLPAKRAAPSRLSRPPFGIFAVCFLPSGRFVMLCVLKMPKTEAQVFSRTQKLLSNR